MYLTGCLVFSPIEKNIFDPTYLLIFFPSLINSFVYTLAFLQRVGETASGNESFVEDANSH